ncbi:MAG: DUF4199 domain-containing protein [Alistipes sp.]|nr:DUF4199 domain-containing protein [Alistipes sp.]
MSIKNFWMDVLRSAAILGVVMALSHIFEQYMLLFSSVDVLTASLIICFEYIAIIVVFVWLVYRFTRSVARNWIDQVTLPDGNIVEVKFTYGRALSYILMVSMLAGVIVGLSNTIFIDIMGYDLFIEGNLNRINEVKLMLDGMAGAEGSQALIADYNKMFDDYRELILTAERPSMFSNIISYMSNYMFSGGIVGLAIAYFARRNVKKNVM